MEKIIFFSSSSLASLPSSITPSVCRCRRRRRRYTPFFFLLFSTDTSVLLSPLLLFFFVPIVIYIRIGCTKCFKLWVCLFVVNVVIDVQLCASIGWFTFYYLLCSNFYWSFFICNVNWTSNWCILTKFNGVLHRKKVNWLWKIKIISFFRQWQSGLISSDPFSSLST